MASEIERKFLVKSDFLKLPAKSKNIVQGYLSVDPEKTVRIRICDRRAYLTIKSQITKSWHLRKEWEFEISLSTANEIMEICLPGRIVKSRYEVKYGNHIFEVDVFHDKNEGLVIAEIELDNENETFEKPEWLGEEVTGRPEFYNSNLI